MKYCTHCLQPDTRPNIFFNDSGICPACQYFEKLTEVDWDERYLILKDLLSKYPRSKDQYFDCIIGVSGGKDSTRQALWVRDKLGLRPLLVCLSYPPQQVTERGVDNISNLIELGFDVLISSPSPETWRCLVRDSFLSFSNWAKSTELALFSAVPQIALKYKIPLILWGENPGLQLGDMKTLGKTGYDGNNLRLMNTLAGGSNTWMYNLGYQIDKLIPYTYPTFDEFESGNLQIVYLGWFLGDWSLVNNAKYSLVNGLKIRLDVVENTGDLMGITSLDEDWVSLNQMIKYYKYGFGRASDYVNEEIRLGHISRQSGIKILEIYDGLCGEEYIKSFCNYIDITVNAFWDIVRLSVNKDLFEIDPSGKIIPKFKVGFGT